MQYTHLNTLQPKHPLAEKVITQLKQQSCSLTDLVKTLGYSTAHQERAIQRLISVLQSETLGLEDTTFDTRYSRSEFLIAILTQLKMPEEDIQQAQQFINTIQSKEPNHHYLLSAKIEYTQPLSAMQRFGLHHQFEKIPVVDNFGQMTAEQQQAWIKTAIQQHSANCPALPYGGQIMEYTLSVDEEIVQRFAVTEF